VNLRTLSRITVEDHRPEDGRSGASTELIIKPLKERSGEDSSPFRGEPDAI
jgi:hypothetical protein